MVAELVTSSLLPAAATTTSYLQNSVKLLE
jgi:hypothetical protein